MPGDTLRLEMTKLACRLNIWKFKGEAWVEDKLVAEAVISAMLQSE